MTTLTPSMFDQPGPQLTSRIEHGREPSLSELITFYYHYAGHGITREKAEQLTKQYILAWLVDFAKPERAARSSWCVHGVSNLNVCTKCDR